MSEFTNDFPKDNETQARMCALQVALTVAAAHPEECVLLCEDGRLGLVVPQSHRPMRFSHYVAGTYVENGSYVITDQWLLASALVTGALNTPFAKPAPNPQPDETQDEQDTRGTRCDIIPFPARSPEHDLPH